MPLTFVVPVIVAYSVQVSTTCVATSERIGNRIGCRSENKLSSVSIHFCMYWPSGFVFTRSFDSWTNRLQVYLDKSDTDKSDFRQVATKIGNRNIFGSFVSICRIPSFDKSDIFRRKSESTYTCKDVNALDRAHSRPFKDSPSEVSAEISKSQRVSESS